MRMRIDGRDSWKVTAVQTLDLCLVCDLGLGCCHSGEECCGECEPRHDLLCVQCFEPSVPKKTESSKASAGVR